MPRKRMGRPPAARLQWARTLALFWAAIVLVGHVSTYREYVRGLDLPPDLIQHLTGMGVFSLLYRASWRAQPGGILTVTALALLVCGGWGALCECLQLLVPLRDFQLRELALNTATPAVVVLLYSLAQMLVIMAETE